MQETKPKVRTRPLSSYLAIFVVMPVLTYLVGSWVDDFLNLPPFPPFPYNLLFGFSVFTAGLAIGIKSTRLLYRLGAGLPWGEVKAEDQSRTLVTTGLYAFSRNPMVLGYSMLPLGMGLMFQSIGMSSTIPAIVLVSNVILVKMREEKRLVARFGEEYLSYKARTPFLIPRLEEVFHALGGWRSGYLKLVFTPLLGLVVLIGLTYQFQSSSIRYQREITAAIFSIICILGIIAGLYPSKTSYIFRKRESISEIGQGMLGHHPTCGSFSTHVIHVKDRTYCSGCSGLVLGAFLGILYTFFHLLIEPILIADLIFSVGVLFVVLGIFQHIIDNNNAVVHAAVNVLLVLGVALVRSSAQTLNGGLIVDVYVLAFTLYLILTRIVLSQNDHKVICNSCLDPCAYSYSWSELES